MIAAEILDFTREGIRDKKSLNIRVVNEIVTSAFVDTGSVDYTIYETKYLPIAINTSGDLKFLGGRWDYAIENAVTPDERSIQFNTASGTFILDATATQVITGDTVRVSYTWVQPQSYTYHDSELNTWIKHAALWTNKASCGETAFSVGGSVDDDTFSISPEPSAYVGQLIGMVAQYEVRNARAAEAETTAIKVRQGPISIDTTKGGRDRLSSLRDARAEIDRRITNIILGEVGGVRLDVYSTKDHNIHDQGYDQETNADSGAGDDPVI